MFLTIVLAVLFLCALPYILGFILSCIAVFIDAWKNPKD